MKRKQIPWYESDQGGPLGRNVEHDPRSRSYRVMLAPNTRNAVVHRRRGPIFDQGQIGSCTGNATVGAIITEPNYRPGKNFREPRALKVYKLATQIDGFPGVYPPDDTGSSGLAACKAAKQLGLISSFQNAFSLDEALDALQVRPVITGLEWVEGFDDPDSSGLVKLTGQVRGGHEFEVLGYDPGDGTPRGSFVRCANSWSPEWGDNGYFRMRVSDWGALLERDGDVTVPIR